MGRLSDPRTNLETNASRRDETQRRKAAQLRERAASFLLSSVYENRGIYDVDRNKKKQSARPLEPVESFVEIAPCDALDADVIAATVVTTITRRKNNDRRKHGFTPISNRKQDALSRERERTETIDDFCVRWSRSLETVRARVRRHREIAARSQQIVSLFDRSLRRSSATTRVPCSIRPESSTPTKTRSRFPVKLI